MTAYPVSRRVWLLALAALVACSGSGCTTVLSTASLRDLVLGLDNRSDDEAMPVASDTERSGIDAEDDSADAERRAAAIEEAVHRLSKIGDLDDAVRATLVATLQRTDQEDWPVVVDAFAESLADAPSTHVVAKADLNVAALESPKEPTPAELEPVSTEPESVTIPDAPAPPPIAAPQPAAATHQSPEEPVAVIAVSAPEPEPASPPAPALLIRNASFASRVQTWGVLDRFADDRFRPGQEVIIYFELENLSAGESAAGHTTCIDSRLRLVTDTGDVAHEWTFEPIAETCRARRHDYFARYMVRVPADAKPGRHRVELTVTDTLSGQAATEAIHFDVVPASPSSE